MDEVADLVLTILPAERVKKVSYQQAFIHARKLYDQLLGQDYHFAHDWCGLLEISYKEAFIESESNSLCS